MGGADRAELETAHGDALHNNDEARVALASVTEAAKVGKHLPPGLHIFTGQTGGGKSALVMNLAHAAIAAHHPVLYVSLELDARELAARLVGVVGGVPWAALALGRPLTTEHRRARDRTLHQLKATATAFYTAIPDGPLELHRLREEVLALWREHELRAPLVCFDYLQLASLRTGEGYQAPLRERIGTVTQELRSLSREDRAAGWPGCPVVVLSSTARASTAGEGKVPGLDGKHPDALRKADLETLKALPKEAGEIEALAVTAWVMALGEKAQGGTRNLTLRLAKNRLGPPGAWVPFRFTGLTGQLAEDAGRYAAPDDPEEKASGKAPKAPKAYD
jgi:replicative DNA helicase